MIDGAVPLVEVTRTDIRSGDERVESIHRGHLVVIGPDNEVAASLGAPEQPVFVRSAVKPFQARACLDVLAEHDGPAGLSTEELAVAWASHRAEPQHVEAVMRLLRRVPLEPDQLTCPAVSPQDEPARSPERRFHNCSGKHALFALAGARLGIAGDALLDPDGPLQRRVLGRLTQALGRIDGVGVDGCGAPAVMAPLDGLARAYHSLLDDPDYTPLVEAGLAHPLLVGGTGRLESALLGAGVLAKVGAEGVYGAAWRDADGDIWSVALKCADGDVRGVSVVLRDLVVAAGAAPLDVWSPEPVLGGGRPQGRIRTVAGLPTPW